MIIRKHNLIVALTLAIKSQKRYESEYIDYNCNFKSTLVAGLEEVLEALKNNERVEIGD